MLIVSRARTLFVALSTVALTAIVACGSTAAPGPPIQIQATLATTGEGAARQLRFDIRTEPNLPVRVSCSGGYGCPAEAHGAADATGHATLTVPGASVSPQSSFTVQAWDPTYARLAGNHSLTLAEAAATTPRLERAETGDLRCVAGTGQCRVSVERNTHRNVIASGFPPGSVLRVGNLQATADATGRATVTLAESLCASARVANILNLGQGFLPSVAVAVRTPTGHETSGQIALAEYGCRDVLVPQLRAIARAPVEPNGADGTGLAYLGNPTTFALGNPARVADVRFVALEVIHERSTRCGPYRNSRTGEVVSFDRSVADSEIIVYVRKTGAVQTRRTFPGSLRCPRTVGGTTELSTSADEASVRRWLGTLVR